MKTRLKSPVRKSLDIDELEELLKKKKLRGGRPMGVDVIRRSALYRKYHDVTCQMGLDSETGKLERRLSQAMKEMKFMPDLIDSIVIEDEGNKLRAKVIVNDELYNDVPYLKDGRIVVVLQKAVVPKLPEMFDEKPVDWNFVRRQAAKTMEIDEKNFELIPEGIAEGLSGSMADFFGIKKRDKRLWVPKGRLGELTRLMKEIRQELMEKKVGALGSLNPVFVADLKECLASQGVVVDNQHEFEKRVYDRVWNKKGRLTREMLEGEIAASPEKWGCRRASSSWKELSSALAKKSLFSLRDKARSGLDKWMLGHVADQIILSFGADQILENPDSSHWVNHWGHDNGVQFEEEEVTKITGVVKDKVLLKTTPVAIATVGKTAQAPSTFETGVLDSALGRLGDAVLETPGAIDAMGAYWVAKYLVNKMKPEEAQQVMVVNQPAGFWAGVEA